jgi:hypothetical protein
MFFALSNQLGYNPEEVKRRVKSHFNLDCFNELTITQINELIERLLLRIEEREGTIANRG